MPVTTYRPKLWTLLAGPPLLLLAALAVLHRSRLLPGCAGGNALAPREARLPEQAAQVTALRAQLEAATAQHAKETAALRAQLEAAHKAQAAAASADVAAGRGAGRRAFMTFLASRATNASVAGLYADGYFQSVRLLAHRVLRNATTRTRLPGAEFVALVTPQVLPLKREILQREGAVVIEVPNDISPAWSDPAYERWKDTWAKLYIWNQTQYGGGILFLDADTQILRNVDAAFGYLDGSEFAAVGDAGPDVMSTRERNPRMFNSGVMALRPSGEAFRRLLWILSREEIKQLYDTRLPDQGLLNWYFRNWTHMPAEFNCMFCWDMRFICSTGVRVMHTKFWWDGEFPDKEGYDDIKSFYYHALENELPRLE